jgi:fructokinase
MEKYDILSVGELLIDLLGTEKAASLHDSTVFEKHLGGSAANLAMNLAKQGKRALLAATVGNDNFGRFLAEELQQAAVGTELLAFSPQPSSMAIVARSSTTPDFIIYRSADAHIDASQLPHSVLSNVRLLHTTCFALSLEPARGNILHAAEEAKKAGAQLSIDLNYAPEVWPNRAEAIQIVDRYLQQGPLVKLSDDDCQRLFGKQFASDEALLSYLHAAGAQWICLTKGAKGCVVSGPQGRAYYEAPKIERVVHATGAGDAFWSGFLSAYLDGEDMEGCVRRGNYIVGIKLQHFGALPKMG